MESFFEENAKLENCLNCIVKMKTQNQVLFQGHIYASTLVRPGPWGGGGRGEESRKTRIRIGHPQFPSQDDI